MSERTRIIALALPAIFVVALLAWMRLQPERPAPVRGGAAPLVGRGDAPRVLGRVAPFTLTDQASEPYGTADLKGKLWIASFIFTRCPSTCPIQTFNMLRLQSLLKVDPLWQEVRLVSVSVDPEHDTPQVLAAYARQHRAEETHWRFLTGTREAIWKISKDSFKLAVADNVPDARMPIVHSSRFVLVDRQGMIRGYYDGMEQQTLDEIIRDARVLATESDSP